MNNSRDYTRKASNIEEDTGTYIHARKALKT